jgi:hypothetical protein
MDQPNRSIIEPINTISNLIGCGMSERPTKDHAQRMLELVENELGERATPLQLLRLAEDYEGLGQHFRDVARERELAS